MISKKENNNYELKDIIISFMFFMINLIVKRHETNVN